MADNNTTYRLVIVHGTTGDDLQRTLRSAGLRVVAHNGDVTIWAPREMAA